MTIVTPGNTWEEALSPSPEKTKIEESPKFPQFKDMPMELRVRIWGYACKVPKNLDLLSGYQKFEVDNTIFYCHYYETKLTSCAVSAILHTCKESREEALKHFSLEWQTDSPQLLDPSKRKLVISFPGFYWNPLRTRLIPRGFYNMLSMIEIKKRIGDILQSFAWDIQGQFYRDLLKDSLEKGQWEFPACREIVLFNGKGVPEFKEAYQAPRVDVDFEDLAPVDESQTPIIADTDLERTIDVFTHHRRLTGIFEEMNATAVTEAVMEGKTSTFVMPKLRCMKVVCRKLTR